MGSAMDASPYIRAYVSFPYIRPRSTSYIYLGAVASISPYIQALLGLSLYTAIRYMLYGDSL